MQCIRQIYTLFRDFFGVGCDGPSIENSDPLHMACYMWWDIFPSWGFRACRGPAIDGACLEVMVATLELRVEVCQIAALHGLNHWYLHHGSEVERAIDAFLASNVPLTSHVREYAKVARRGGSQ